MEGSLLEDFRRLYAMAVEEDSGTLGDVTGSAIFQGQTARARIIARQDACLSGVEAARLSFLSTDPSLGVQCLFADGDRVNRDQVVIEVEGSVASLLRAERIALNFLGYLSGIATQTRELADLMASLGTTSLLDTRKTLPGYRRLAKAAVVHGGGKNHRMGLHDMVMIKDNHIDAAGGIGPAVEAVRKRWGTRFRIEVECRTLTEVREALELAPEVIMLDNMDLDACRDAIRIRREEFPGSVSAFEASGDMDRERIRSFAAIGLDFISVGRITHSVTNANFSMRMA